MSQGMEKVQEYTNLLHSSVPLQVTPEKTNKGNVTEGSSNTGKRGRDSRNSKPSPTTPSQPPPKRADLQASGNKHSATTRRASSKPLYPTHEDRKEVEDASERGTRLKIMGIEISVEPKTSPYEKVSNEDLWDHLVKQKALIASTIETISTDLLKQALEEKKVLSGAQHIAEVVSDKVANKATEILCSFLDTTEATEAIIAVATAAGHSVATGIMATPPPVKLSFQESDSQSVLEFKLNTLTLSNPTHLWADKLALHCVRSGLRTQLSEYQREGLLSEVHKVHANMVNDITEVTAHNRATQVQVATLTSAVTELLHKPCDKQLRLYGLEELINTKLHNPKDQKARRQRISEATEYLKAMLEGCGYKNNFILDLIEPAHNRNKGPPLVGIITLPYESDKYRVEGILKEVRSKGLTKVTSRRNVAGNHKASNLPTTSDLDAELRVLYTRKLNEDLTTLSTVSGNEERVKILQTKYSLDQNYRFVVRKKTSDKDPKTFYEFLCPASNSVYMTYKYENTFNQYDFCHDIANPRLRLMAKQSGREWVEKHHLAN